MLPDFVLNVLELYANIMFIAAMDIGFTSFYVLSYGLPLFAGYKLYKKFSGANK